MTKTQAIEQVCKNAEDRGLILSSTEIAYRASLLIEDEVHRCVKNYSYTFVAKKYLEQALNQRLIGLSASPGADKKTIKMIFAKLLAMIFLFHQILAKPGGLSKVSFFQKRSNIMIFLPTNSRIFGAQKSKALTLMIMLWNKNFIRVRTAQKFRFLLLIERTS